MTTTIRTPSIASPLEVALDLMPHRVTLGGVQLQIDYRPIGASEPYDRYLVVVTDVTADVEREHAEIERHEAMVVFERVLADRSGVESFFEEGSQIVTKLARSDASSLGTAKRMLQALHMSVQRHEQAFGVLETDVQKRVVGQGGRSTRPAQG